MAQFAISFQGNKSDDRYQELAKIVNNYDFQTISVYQDLFFQPPWPALLQFAKHTNHPLIGPSVINPYLCHPVLTASNLALLDQTSNGRAYLGIGKGAWLKEVGIQQPKPIEAIRETIELVQQLLEGKRQSYEGTFFQLPSKAHLRFTIPERKLPVLIGGWGPRILSLAGQIADMAKVGGCANPECVPIFRNYLIKGAQQVGRDPSSIKLIFGAVTVVDYNADVAEQLARRNVAMYVGITAKLDPTFSTTSQEIAAIQTALDKGDEEAAANALSKETLKRFSVFGTPHEITIHLEKLFDAGIDIFDFGTPHGVNENSAIRILGEEIIPYFTT